VVVEWGLDVVVVPSDVEVDERVVVVERDVEVGAVVVDVDVEVEVDVLGTVFVVARGAVVGLGVVASIGTERDPSLGVDAGRTRMYVTSAATKISAVTAVVRRTWNRFTTTARRCRLRCRSSARCLHSAARWRCGHGACG
jgi:hypothetical protein